jgi:hypothetical protein
MTRNNNKLSTPQHAFADTVAIDAWYDPFTEDCHRADLRVDVTFRKDVPVGSEPESPVRFRLGLRRAEVAVIIPDDGSIAIDRDSVAREALDIAGHRRITQAKNQKIVCSGEVGIDLNHGVSGKSNLGGEINYSQAIETELNQNLRLMMVVHSPTSGPVLDGKPWHATSEPRLKLIDKRSKKAKQLSSVTVEIRCRREDLYISNLELKEDDRRKIFLRRKQNPNAMAAAEGYIRACLERAGLDLNIGSIDEKFMKLILSRICANQ